MVVSTPVIGSVFVPNLLIVFKDPAAVKENPSPMYRPTVRTVGAGKIFQ